MLNILNIITSGPMILVDMPSKYNWSPYRKALTALMRTFGMRQKDIVALEYLSGDEWFGPDSGPYYQECAYKMCEAFAAAEAGDPKRLPDFYLYRYEVGKGFVLLRPPTI
jgi:hypothetical protein